MNSEYFIRALNSVGYLGKAGAGRVPLGLTHIEAAGWR